MIDWKKPIRTKSEKKVVRILCTDFPGQRPIVAQIDGEEEPFLYTQGGSYFLEPEASGWDLENVPQPPPKPPAAQDVLEKIYLIRNTLDSFSWIPANREAMETGLTHVEDLAQMLQLKYQRSGR